MPAQFVTIAGAPEQAHERACTPRCISVSIRSLMRQSLSVRCRHLRNNATMAMNNGLLRDLFPIPILKVYVPLGSPFDEMRQIDG